MQRERRGDTNKCQGETAMQQYMLSCPDTAIYIKIDKGVIVDIDSEMQRFIGQHYSNLTRWLKQFGKVTIYNLYSGKDKRDMYE